jgi:7SK snRNA methylphosphate capping enzyme
MKGSYHGYYQKRLDLDERLAILQKSWFESKVCLDIGCNDGLITMEIAERYSPEFITGIDIDGFLIESAISRIKRAKFAAKQEVKEVSAKSSSVRFLPRSVGKPKTGNRTTNAVINSMPIITEPVIEAAVSAQFPENVQFIRKDIFELEESTDGRYDTILCLSLTKWIHLNGGDSALLDLFQKIHSLLKANGLFLLEYQPWKSYKKRKDLTPKMERYLQEIEILPNMFKSTLIEKYHFEVLECRNEDESLCSGFVRPFLVLRKL